MWRANCSFYAGAPAPRRSMVSFKFRPQPAVVALLPYCRFSIRLDKRETDGCLLKYS